MTKLTSPKKSQEITPRDPKSRPADFTGDKFAVRPHGLSLGQGEFRPAMIFKDADEREVLPVWLDPLEANLLLVLAQSRSASTGIHKAAFKVFRNLKVVLKSIYFDDVSGNSQFATLETQQGNEISFTKVRASEAVSLALNAGVSFFTNRDVVSKSRAMSLDMLMQSDTQGMMKNRSTEDLH